MPNDILAELEASWVTVNEDAPMRGYACLVFRRHAVELHDLTEAEGAAFMRDVRRLSAAVQEVTGAVKLNYEVHGNTIPHLHMHFYPRYPGDSFEGEPINAKAVRQPVYAPGEFTVVRTRLLAALKRLVGVVLLLMTFGVACSSEAGPSSNVAYRRIDIQDAVTSELFPVALWYPTHAAPAPLFLTGSLSTCRLPAMLCRLIAFEMHLAMNARPADGTLGLIIISHGAGGLSLNHRDLAMALASRGYVVAAPTHPRGKDNDISGVGVWFGRPRQVSGTIDAVLADAALGSRIDHERIGVVGHSNGGHTALAVAGAKASPRAITEHCRQHPDDVKFCSYGGRATREATATVGDVPDVHDARVRGIVLMAPNAAPFTDDALAKVRVPVRLYGAERDDLTQVRYHAERLAKALPP